jgi:hypothetical protein
MTGTHYGSRPYRIGDEVAINELYFRVTGCRRSAEQFAWQWLHAPGGKADIWLIEATHPDGRLQLIGHHGVMPIRFTWRDRDLLFGKTENTMVLPEYRRKILYPRFERKFASTYEPRYHALLSTMGPPEAIRQRQAMGYRAQHHWMRFESGRPPWASLIRLLSNHRSDAGDRFMRFLGCPRRSGQLPAGVHVLPGEEARKDPFFDGYWRAARMNWGVAPSRDAMDLTWRCWENPYAPHYAVIIRRPGMGDALLVVEHRTPGTAEIVDVSAHRPDPGMLRYALEVGMQAVAKRLGVRLFTFHVTEDALAPDALAELRPVFRPTLLSRLRRTEREAESKFMPRKITEMGERLGVPSTPWNITMLIAEGRR